MSPAPGSLPSGPNSRRSCLRRCPQPDSTPGGSRWGVPLDNKTAHRRSRPRCSRSCLAGSSHHPGCPSSKSGNRLCKYLQFRESSCCSKSSPADVPGQNSRSRWGTQSPCRPLSWRSLVHSTGLACTAASARRQRCTGLASSSASCATSSYQHRQGGEYRLQGAPLTLCWLPRPPGGARCAAQVRQSIGQIGSLPKVLLQAVPAPPCAPHAGRTLPQVREAREQRMPAVMCWDDARAERQVPEDGWPALHNGVPSEVWRGVSEGQGHSSRNAKQEIEAKTSIPCLMFDVI